MKNGIFWLSTSGTTVAAVLLSRPTATSMLLVVANAFCTEGTASAGSPKSSTGRQDSCCPSTPPAWLITATAALHGALRRTPNEAPGPVNGATTATLIVPLAAVAPVDDSANPVRASPLAAVAAATRSAWLRLNLDRSRTAASIRRPAVRVSMVSPHLNGLSRHMGRWSLLVDSLTPLVLVCQPGTPAGPRTDSGSPRHSHPRAEPRSGRRACVGGWRSIGALRPVGSRGEHRRRTEATQERRRPAAVGASPTDAEGVAGPPLSISVTRSQVLSRALTRVSSLPL